MTLVTYAGPAGVSDVIDHRFDPRPFAYYPSAPLASVRYPVAIALAGLE